jgi:hypothetical protein
VAKRLVLLYVAVAVFGACRRAPPPEAFPDYFARLKADDLVTRYQKYSFGARRTAHSNPLLEFPDGTSLRVIQNGGQYSLDSGAPADLSARVEPILAVFRRDKIDDFYDEDTEVVIAFDLKTFNPSTLPVYQEKEVVKEDMRLLERQGVLEHVERKNLERYLTSPGFLDKRPVKVEDGWYYYQRSFYHYD